MISDRYLVGANYKVLESQKDDKTKREHIGFRYYDLEGNLKEREFDVLKELQKQYPDSYISSFFVLKKVINILSK